MPNVRHLQTVSFSTMCGASPCRSMHRTLNVSNRAAARRHWQAVGLQLLMAVLLLLLTLHLCLPKLQVPPLLSPEQGFPMQKACTGLLLDALGRLLASSSDGCCYLLDPETLQRTAKLILQPSLAGDVSCPPHCAVAIWCSSDQIV